MPRLVEALKLRGNPFEFYVAEKEPDIAVYAVKPPYFEAIDARAKNMSSYILFGERGAGKSATRLTVFKEIWRKKEEGKNVPLAVNMTDFSELISGKQINNSNEASLVGEVAFIVIEKLLTWLSSLSEGDRSIYLEGLNQEEKELCYLMLRDHYLSRSPAKRERSVHEAMILLDQAFIAKSKLWVERRWEPIAKLVGAITDALSRRYVVDTKDSISGDVTAVISPNKDKAFDSILLLRKLVSLVKVFSFSGIVILIDKVDETDATSNSADKTTELIYPLLARVQLMEVDNFSWIYFLWDKVKSGFEEDKYKVRLDKIGYATVSWSNDFFSLMLDKRVRYFSNEKIGFEGLFSPETDISQVKVLLMRVSMRSPREVIRLMDIIIREHDISHATKEDVVLLDTNSVELGIDSYVTDRISSVYGERLLGQIFRLNKTVFINKDVQLAFRVGAQSARTRIQSWENAGIIKLSGTRSAEGSLGGKPANEYTIIDARVERIMQKQLISYDEPVVEEAEFDINALE